MAGKLPSPKNHPNLFGWAAIAGKYNELVIKKWPAGDLEIP